MNSDGNSQRKLRSITLDSSVLEGIVEHFVFCNEENGWCVVRLTVKGYRDPVTVVGSILGVQPGESIRLNGCWVSDKKYGEQFKAESYTTVKPATVVGIEKYLGSGMIKGIGPIMASRLVKVFGTETIDIIEEQPKRLTEVEGIGKIRAESIYTAFQEQKQIKEVMLFLQSHGVTTTYAIKIYKHYGDSSIEVVAENPYRLAIEIFGIGFKTADKIAGNLGIDPTSIRRAEAGVLHVLGALSDSGHVCYPKDALVLEASKLLEVENILVENAIDSLYRQEMIVIDKDESFVYAKSLYACETGSAQNIRLLLEKFNTPIYTDIAECIELFEKKFGLELADKQKQAIEQALKSKVMIITGGPGTGKTTLVNGIIQILTSKGKTVLLTAPTGRAAKRMSESTGLEAKTLHRLLEYSPRLGRFERNAEHQLRADMIIVDETSMLDIVLFYSLLKAIPVNAQLILVGDVDQLPSVGPGNVLRDCIDSGEINVVRLTEIFRQARESLIVLNAHAINSGRTLVKEQTLKQDNKLSDFYFVERDEPEAILEMLKKLIKERIPKRYGYQQSDIQVLTPMHMGLLGASNLNKVLQELINTSNKTISRGNKEFKLADRVMQVRNNYDLDVYNGDIGYIANIDQINHEVTIDFDGRQVLYEAANLDELVLAYACSVHKSQGSEYPVVILPLHTQHYLMLQRNLLYTAITRGKKLVVVIGSKKAVAIAVKNNKTEMRYTKLSQRIKTANLNGSTALGMNLQIEI